MKKYTVSSPVNFGNEGKTKWVRVGIAFDNKDGSINVIFDALPLNGKVTIKEQSQKEN